jgi:heterodisulfide reductase subunit C
MEPDLTFMERVSELSGEAVGRCYYCMRCSAGCPSAYAMEYGPAQVLKMVQMGQKEALLGSGGIWLCIGCETCGTRCPNEIHAGAVIDALRQMSVAEGVRAGEPKVYKLHRAFLDSIRMWGRMDELSMLVEYKLLSRDLLSDMDMGLDMFVKGKIHVLPKRIRGVKEVQRLFGQRPEGKRGKSGEGA